MERACELHGVKMTRHGLLHKGLTSADNAEPKYAQNFEALIMKQPNLGYADVKLHFACMHPEGCARRVSLYYTEYYDLCDQIKKARLLGTKVYIGNRTRDHRKIRKQARNKIR